MKQKALRVVLLTLFLSFTAYPIMAQESNDKNISLRANLLRWASLTPDLGIELSGYGDWSILANGTYTHWSWSDKDRHYGLWEASVEARRYLCDAKRAYVGAQAKVGQFNYKLSDTGKQGDIVGGGITAGYKLPLGKRFALDFTVGAGYLYVIDLEKYNVVDGIRVFTTDKRNKGYWGITNLGLVMSYEL